MPSDDMVGYLFSGYRESQCSQEKQLGRESSGKASLAITPNSLLSMNSQGLRAMWYAYSAARHSPTARPIVSGDRNEPPNLGGQFPHEVNRRNCTPPPPHTLNSRYVSIFIAIYHINRTYIS
jgi:hypothetical protein